MYRVKLQQFEGPLDLLLQLIEAEELDISQVSLGTVTDQFIKELERATWLSPDELADFLVVAAKLLFIKSKILLPGVSDEADDAGADLERQLKMYRVFLEAARGIHKLLLKRRFSYPRETVSTITPVFNPPQDLTTAALQAVFRDVIAGIEPLVAISETVMARTVSLRQKIEDLKNIVNQQATVNFKTLLQKAESRIELIVIFLALLELVKQQMVVVVQESIFTDITIQTKEAQDHDARR